MVAAKYNFLCEQGAKFERVLTLKDPDGEPLDLTGYSIAMQVRRDVRSDTVVVELTTDEDGGITIGEDGQITLFLPASATAELTADGVYDMELIPPSGPDYAEKVLRGVFRVEREVTRDA
jgi:hypothetical protein